MAYEPVDKGCYAGFLFVFVIGIVGCATSPGEYDKPVTNAFEVAIDSYINQAIASQAKNNPGKSGFYLLGDGLEAFAARIALARTAERSLDIQYYLWHDDEIGRLLGHAVLQAADRGVRVRVLIDDIGTKGKDMRLALFDHHKNIEIRVFNPFKRRGFGRGLDFITHLSKVNNRMHNKSFTVDNVASILGGRNIGDEYFSLEKNFNFADVDILSLGPVVQDVSKSFDIFWNSHWATPIMAYATLQGNEAKLESMKAFLAEFAAGMEQSEYIQAVRKTNLVKKLLTKKLSLIWANASLYYDRPEKVVAGNTSAVTHLRSQVILYFEASQSEMIFINPYFIPGDEGVEFFKRAAERGVRVRILTNSLAANNQSTVHGGYAKYRKPLLESGIELYELRATSFKEQKKENYWVSSSSTTGLHAKVAMIDGRYVFIGSANLDPRSRNINTEIGIMIDSKAIAEQLYEGFEAIIQPANSYRLIQDAKTKRLAWIGENDGKEIRHKRDPDAGWWRRFQAFMARILPVESLL